MKRRPFLAVPDTELYFSTKPMEEARRVIERAVRRGEGIALLFGVSGTGKTLLLRLLRDSLKPDYNVSIISNSHLETPKSFFQQLLYELQLPFSNGDEIELRFQLLDFARQNKTCVILIDESQFLSTSILEEIRLLTDCDNGSVPFFRIVLAGNIEFEEKLTEPSLHAFNQRVVHRAYLETLSREETGQYITWQLDVSSNKNDLSPVSSSGLAEWIEHSGGNEGRRIDSPHIRYSEPIVTENAKQLIFQLTDGLPRSINQLCDMAFHLAAERIVRQIDEHLIHDTWTKLQQIAGHSEEKQTESISATLVSTSFKNIDEIVARKKATFQPKTFSSAVEFGTLDDTEIIESAENEPTECEPIESEKATIIRFRSPNEYKPPYPEDDHWEDEYSEQDGSKVVLFESETTKIEQSESDKIETKNELPSMSPQLNQEQHDCCSEKNQEMETNSLDFYDVLENDILFSDDTFPRLRELPISEEWNDTIEAVAEAVTEKGTAENAEVLQTATKEFLEQNIAENVDLLQTTTEKLSEQNIAENADRPQITIEEDIEQYIAQNIETVKNVTEESIEQNVVHRSSTRIYPHRRQRIKENFVQKYRHRIIVSTVSTGNTETPKSSYCHFGTLSLFLMYCRFDAGETWIGNRSLYPLFFSVRFPIFCPNETVETTIDDTIIVEAITNETKINEPIVEEAIIGEAVISETIEDEPECHNITVTENTTVTETENTVNNEPSSDDILVDIDQKHCSEESEMDKETLEKYGAEVLEGRPPFVRKEPNYAYQTTDFAPEIIGKIPYQDFMTGNVILLNWTEPEHNSENGFGTSYREFVTRDTADKNDLDKFCDEFQEKQYYCNEFNTSPVVQTTLNPVANLSQSIFVVPNQKTSLDEPFDETVAVETLAVPLKESSDRSVLPHSIFSNNFSIPSQIEAAIRRITRAAEKIEQAAEQSNNAGQQIKQAACFVETEIKTVLPTYVELFRELTEFQQMVSNELNGKHSEHQITEDPHEQANRHERPVRLLPFPVHINTGVAVAAQFVSEIKSASSTDESTQNEKSIDFQKLFQ
ncbi:MAG: AAA family ATPase [Planctomycetaceae bacterium]|nr:AAA family ATPase [Planctomycetaceae bacterium]